jgi:hypothetical protein
MAENFECTAACNNCCARIPLDGGFTCDREGAIFIARQMGRTALPNSVCPKGYERGGSNNFQQGNSGAAGGHPSAAGIHNQFRGIQYLLILNSCHYWKSSMQLQIRVLCELV